MAVTPMQMAVAYSAIANGGTVLWPRLVERIEPQDPASGETATNFPSGLVRDEIGVKPRSLKILRDAMLSETEEGTGQAAVVGLVRVRLPDQAPAPAAVSGAMVTRLPSAASA